MRNGKEKRDLLLATLAATVFLPAGYLVFKRQQVEKTEKQAKEQAQQRSYDKRVSDALNGRFAFIRKAGDKVVLIPKKEPPMRSLQGVLLTSVRQPVVLKVGYYFENQARHQFYERYTLLGMEKDGIVILYEDRAIEQEPRHGRVKLKWKN